MGGFSDFKHLLALGIYGDDRIVSVACAINARANTLIADGIRFQITHRLRRAAVKVDFGLVNSGGKLGALRRYEIPRIGTRRNLRGTVWMGGIMIFPLRRCRS